MNLLSSVFTNNPLASTLSNFIPNPNNNGGNYGGALNSLPQLTGGFVQLPSFIPNNVSNPFTSISNATSSIPLLGNAINNAQTTASNVSNLGNNVINTANTATNTASSVLNSTSNLASSLSSLPSSITSLFSSLGSSSWLLILGGGLLIFIMLRK